MKKYLFATILTLTLLQLSAQNVGIGTSSPGTKLDVNGAFTLRETTIAVSGNAATIPANVSQVQLTGSATGSITLTGPVPPNAGQAIIIYNNTTGGFPAIFSGSTIPAGQIVDFTYSNSGWHAVNGAVSSVGNTSVSNTLSTTVNAVTGAGVNIINSNALSLSGTNLTSTVNGQASNALDISAIDKNIYTNDGTLAASRTVSMNALNLTFASTTGNLVYAPASTGRVGIGTASPAGLLHVSVPSSNGNTAAWSSSNVVIGQSGSTGGALGFSYSTTDNGGTGYISSLAPNVAWEYLGYRASNHLFYTNGANEAMRIASNGFVSIGLAATPIAPLEITNTGDIAYALLNTTATTNRRTRLNFSQNGTIGMEIGTDYSMNNTNDMYLYNRATGSTAAYFNPGSNVWLTARNTSADLYLNASGNVGIGTTNPVNKLQVEGNLHMDGNSMYFRAGPADQYDIIRWNSATDRIDVGGYNGVTLGYCSPSTNVVTGTLNVVGGFVGIGTSSPNAPLHIAYNNNTFNQGSYTYYAQGNNSTINGTFCSCNSNMNANFGNASCTGCGVSLYAVGRIQASEFDAFSDQRIKKDFHLSDAADDMETLNRLEVTDFRYKDELENGSNFKKGFIAQQIRDIYPQAVTEHTDFITDVFAMPEASTLANGTLTVRMKAVHGFCEGDEVRFIVPSGRVELPVHVQDEHTFTVDQWSDTSSQVFVYGKKANDFLTIDYDRIYTLNVSATQELAKQLKTTQAELVAVKAENAKLKQAGGDQNDIIKTMKAQIDAISERLNITSVK